jgi:hypothetical protein
VNAEILEQSRLSLMHDDSEHSRLSEKFMSTDKESQSSVAFTVSPYDSYVPGPRLSGARFNQNGLLFGQKLQKPWNFRFFVPFWSSRMPILFGSKQSRRKSQIN